MGRAPLLLVLLLIPPHDDLTTAQKALIDAIVAGEHEAIKTNFQKIVAFNETRSTDALQDAFKKSVESLKTFEKEVEKWKKEMDDNKIVYDNKGRFQRGNSVKYNNALTHWEDARKRYAYLEYWLPELPRAYMKLNSESAVQGLIGKLRGGTEWIVRAYAALALAKVDSKDGLAALLEVGAKEIEPGVREAIADALAVKPPSPEARAILEGCLADECWQVRSAAQRSLAAIADRNSIPVMIESLKTTTGRMANETNDALKKLTGVDKHGDYNAWKDWFAKNKEEVLGGAYKPKSNEMADNPGGSTFYGVRVTSNRILFMVGCSQTTTWEARWKPEDKGDEPLKGNTVLDVLKHQLRSLIRTLPDTTEFQIMLFWREMKLCFDKPSKAVKSNRDKALKFVDDIKVDDGAWMFKALNKALEQAGGPLPHLRIKPDSYDTIYLITDGEAQGGVERSDGLTDRFAALNQFRRIAVISVGTGSQPWQEETLKALSAGPGGTYIKR